MHATRRTSARGHGAEDIIRTLRLETEHERQLVNELTPSGSNFNSFKFVLVTSPAFYGTGVEPDLGVGSLVQVDEQRDFHLALIRALTGQPIEDGQSHPAETLLESALIVHGRSAIEWIESLFSQHEKGQPSIAAGLLRCIGRMDEGRAADWGKPIIIRSFGNPDAEIREAAVRALEHWGGADSVEILRYFASHESEPWLKSYMQEVLEDLSN